MSNTIFDPAFQNLEGIARVVTGKFLTSPSVAVSADTNYGTFGTLGNANQFTKAANSTTAITHFLCRADQPRVSPSDIVNNSQLAKSGELCLTLSGGSGEVLIQVRPLDQSDINEGTDLICGTDGYATPRSGTAAAAFILGRTTQEYKAPQGPSQLVWVRALLTLPAQYRPIGS